MNALFRSASGVRRMYVSRKCKTLARAFRVQRWDQKGQPEKPLEGGLLDGLLDAAGYLACGAMGVLAGETISSASLFAERRGRDERTSAEGTERLVRGMGGRVRQVTSESFMR